MTHVEERRSDPTGDNDVNAKPSEPAQSLGPYQLSPYAGKNDAGILEVGRDKRIAQMVSPRHGHLAERGRHADENEIKNT